ncbi:hypothetical protein RND81_12G035600, partial [Saponaria officinalis]
MAFSLQRYMEPDVNSKLIQLFKYRSKKERERSIGIEIANANGNCLNEGVIVEILSWLPMKSLLQYKSLCKAWHAIISSPDFVSKHLRNYYGNRNDSEMRDFFLKQSYVDYDLYHLQSLVLAVDETRTPRVIAFQDMVNMPMYVLRNPWPLRWFLRVLPPLLTKTNPVLDPCQTAGEVYGLGFDYVSSDYKVVVIKGYLNNINKCYNLINRWYYWMESDYIYDYNKMSDAIFEINLPDYKKPALKSHGIYDDYLALLSFHLDDKLFEVRTFKVGIWAMKLRIGPFLDVWFPIGHWKGNKLFLESYD